MSAAQRRFMLLLISVSGIAVLAVAMLTQGIEHDRMDAAVIGALLALCAALGIVVLGRIVFVTERNRSRR